MNLNKGFTLIELMIVVVILGILAAVAIPNFLKFQCRAKESEAKNNLGGIFTALTGLYATYNSYSTDLVCFPWVPSGSPRYIYGFAEDNFNPLGLSLDNFPCRPGRNHTAIPDVISLSNNKYNTQLMVKSDATPLTGADLPQAAVIPRVPGDNSTFAAGAAGDVIENTGGIFLSSFIIDETRTITIIGDDCSQ